MQFGFEIVNVLAVGATASLMLALFLLWRSPLLMGRFLHTSKEEKDASSQTTELSLTHIGLSLGVLFCALFVLAYMLAVAPKAGLEPLLVAAFTCVMVLSVAGMYALMDARSLRAYVVDALYIAVLFIGGALLLLYWPV